ncbi:hypothetical protein Ahy_A04g021631 [Arachis hypogaea]|uniref:Uncharacterized protein n=1 Tax=Arachis hypogaea TaxID=3818 RepID=A0A445DKZ9_ARAHY|nr:hypothetical protein Ahy_A04g021631 [Arachis hypogaea]
MEATPNTQQQDDDDIVCLDASFFLNDNYQLTNFTFGSQDIQLFCLQSASRQLVWPGAMLLNDYLSKNVEMLRGCTAIELGSGVDSFHFNWVFYLYCSQTMITFILGITGILCSRFCHKVVMTDHNEEILNKNIELHSCSDNTSPSSRGLFANKLEWGNSDQINDILQNHPGGFDLQSSVPMLFNTVEQLLWAGEGRRCKFILAYVSRTKIMDSMIIIEASKHQMQMKEVPGTRRIVGNLEGVIYEITLGSKH